MTRRSMVRWVVAVVTVVFIGVNLWGVWVAAAAGELVHTGIHVGLLLVAAFLILRFAPGRGTSEGRLAAGQGVGARR